MKKLIMLLGLVLMFSLVSAIEINEGDIITQSQLDNINISNLDHNDLKCQKDGNIQKVYGKNGQKMAVQEGSCLTLIENDDDYLVTRKKLRTTFDIIDFVVCMEGDTRANCVIAFWDSLRQQAKSFISNIKAILFNYQTDPRDTDLGNDFDNLNLFG